VSEDEAPELGEDDGMEVEPPVASTVGPPVEPEPPGLPEPATITND
jgi:hypothetical protein